MWNRSVTFAHRANSGLAEGLGVTTDLRLMILQRVNLTPTNASILGCANRSFVLESRRDVFALQGSSGAAEAELCPGWALLLRTCAPGE